MKASGVLMLAVLLVGCHRGPAGAGDTPGDRIEAAARTSGLVIDPASRSLTGSWARETDHACIVPAGKETRIGVVVDYGEGQFCVGRGTLVRDGAMLEIRMGDCRVKASFDGERIVFPGAVPAACERLCTGRASLAAMAVDRLSASRSEAATLRAPGDRMLCES